MRRNGYYSMTRARLAQSPGNVLIGRIGLDLIWRTAQTRKSTQIQRQFKALKLRQDRQASPHAEEKRADREQTAMSSK